MRMRAVEISLIIAMSVGLAGCQSGPRWAWWKSDIAPDDTSLVSRTAAPALPSTQAQPQPVPAAGSDIAAPPSSANLATAAPPTANQSQVPAGSAGTIYSAPVASYPGATSTSPLTTTAAPHASAAAPVPASTTGPYDPYAYHPQAPAETHSAGPAPTDDRYGTPSPVTPDDYYPASPQVAEAAAPQVPDRYATAPSQVSGGAGLPTPNHEPAPYGGLADAGPLHGEVGTYPSVEPDRYSNVPPAPAPVDAVPPVPSLESIQLAAPAGQYRPGGTSTFIAGSPNGRVDVASRPQSSPPTDAATPTSPAPGPAQVEPITPVQPQGSRY